MPEPKRPLKVFLSYASQDQSVVRELSGRLASEGWIDPWVDAKKLLPGQDWRTKIEEAVETSDIVIVVLSNNSVAKEGYVQKELRFAQEIALEKPEETIFLIPLRLENCNVPRGLRFFQWVDYFEDKKEESYGALIESFKLRYQQVLKSEEERAQKEKEKRDSEFAEKLASEKAERESAEKLAREKAERKAVEKATRDRAEREATEIAEREREEKAKEEKLVREALEKAKREKAEREASEKATKETARRETTEKAKLERAERRVAFIAALKEKFSRSFNYLKSSIPKVFSKLRVIGLTGIAIVIFWLVLQTPFKPASLLPTATPSATVTLIPLTRTRTPTLTLTPIVPTQSVLLQEDFEDGVADDWPKWGGSWSYEKDLNGNRYWSVSTSEKNGASVFYYGTGWTRWTDYAFESRIMFVEGPHNLTLWVRSGGGAANYSFIIDGGYCSFYQNTNVKGLSKELSPDIPRLFEQGRFYTIRVEIKGDVISAYIDNIYLLEAKIPAEMIDNVPTILNKQGGIGYSFGAGETINIDDVWVWPLN